MIQRADDRAPASRHDGDGRGNLQNLDRRFSALAYALKGIDLPQDKAGLRQCAEDNGAQEEVLNLIENMPEEEYQTMADVIAAIDAQDATPQKGAQP